MRRYRCVFWENDIFVGKKEVRIDHRQDSHGNQHLGTRSERQEIRQ